MTFANRVIDDRKLLGKDTRLTIRGDVVSREEVQKYWRRKAPNVDDIPLMASTPPGVRYWTPSPSPSLATRSLSSTLYSDTSTTSTTSEGNEVTTINFNDHDLWTGSDVVGYFESSLGPVMTPDYLKTQELVLVQAKMYIQSSMEACDDLELAEGDRVIAGFVDLTRKWLNSVVYGRAHYTARMNAVAVDALIPKVVSKMHPNLLGVTMKNLVVYYHVDGLDDPEVKQAVQKLLLKLQHHICAAYAGSSPLPTLFWAMAQHIDDIVPWTKAIIELAKDIVTSSPSNSTLQSWMLYVQYSNIADVHHAEENYQTSLHYAKRAEKAAATLDHWSVTSSLWVRERRVLAMTHMEAFADAEALIHATLATCLNEWDAVPTARDMYSRMLYKLVIIRYRQERTAEGWQLVNQVLATRLNQYGLDDDLVSEIGRAFMDTEQSHGTGSSEGVQSGCEEPLSWPCDQVNSVRETRGSLSDGYVS